MDPFEPIYSFNIGELVIDIKPEALIQLAIVIFIVILSWWSTKDLKFKPNGKKQVIIEYIYTTLQNIIKSNMGEKYYDVIPFIGSMSIFILLMNLMGLVGIPSPTRNFSVTISLGVIAFCYIQGYTIKKIGIKNYLCGYAKPVAIMLPINTLERVMLPISLALRLFGNILAATFLVELVYTGLSMVGWAAQLGLPVVLHAYFDIFDGVIQMVIFSMLTMINIKTTVEH